MKMMERDEVQNEKGLKRILIIRNKRTPSQEVLQDEGFRFKKSINIPSESQFIDNEGMKFRRKEFMDNDDEGMRFRRDDVLLGEGMRFKKDQRLMNEEGLRLSLIHI